ncbi:MAG: peptidase M14 [Verrucomicrobiales bacterium]|nr:peptidase M14 [Verrucomicrobiales bacterium]
MDSARSARLGRIVVMARGWVCLLVWAMGGFGGWVGRAAETPAASMAAVRASGLEFLDTSFENASPLGHEVDPDGVIQLHLMYDHERASPNRAAGHLHFRIHARAGTTLRFEFRNLDNVWNGIPGSVAREFKAVVISEDGREWRSVPTESLPGDRVRWTVTMPGPSLYVARVEPYRLSDLDTFLAWAVRQPQVEVQGVGWTVQGRRLEILRIGRAEAPRRLFVRARAHPWEAGGNWVVEGLVRRLLAGDEEAAGFLRRYCVEVMPMANKDGVALGRTRFNLCGKDLNREWDRPADVALAPENAALERWLSGRIQSGRRPHLALDLHNDGRGLLHISRPQVPGLTGYLERMRTLERMLRAHTWFTEGSTEAEFRNPGSLGDGWLERFGIDAVVHEFNCHWVAGLEAAPTRRAWEDYGARLARAIDAYFQAVTLPDAEVGTSR